MSDFRMSLTALDLQWNALGDEGAKAIAELVQQETLISLKLDGIARLPLRVVCVGTVRVRVCCVCS